MARILALSATLVIASTSAAASLANFSNRDVVAALKEALTKSSHAAVSRLGVENGFFGDEHVKIPLPDSLKRAERVMRSIGMGKQADELVLRMNRAAEAAGNGISTIHGSAFECRVQSETCSLLYLNPPYDNELGPHSNQRMELVFLDHCYRWVMTEGVLVFVIPTTALGPCARLLAGQ